MALQRKQRSSYPCAVLGGQVECGLTRSPQARSSNMRPIHGSRESTLGLYAPEISPSGVLTLVGRMQAEADRLLSRLTKPCTAGTLREKLLTCAVRSSTFTCLFESVAVSRSSPSRFGCICICRDVLSDHADVL